MKKNLICLIAALILNSSFSLFAQESTYSKEKINTLRLEISELSKHQKPLYILAEKIFNKKMDKGVKVLSIENYKLIQSKLLLVSNKLSQTKGKQSLELEKYVSNLNTRYISTNQIVELAKLQSTKTK